MRTLCLIGCLCLLILFPAIAPRAGLAEEFPTINDLIESGALDEEMADEAPAPPPAEPSPEPAPEPAPTPAEDGDVEEAPEPALPPSPPVPAPDGTPVPPPPIRLSQKVVMIGRVPFKSAKRIMEEARSLTEFLRKEMGVKDVRLVTGNDYAGVLSALERGTIDFAWLGPMAYVIGSEKTPLIPLVQANRRTGATYRGVFITRKDSQIYGIEDIKGRVIGFVDPESASGYLYPLYLLKRTRINPHKDCRKVEFLGKHDAILAAVLTGKIDVGVCLEDTIEAVKDKKILDQILILGKTDEVPSDVVACRQDCHPSLRDKLQAALIKTRAANLAAAREVGRPFIMEFLPVNEAYLNSVRHVLRAIKDVRQP